MAVLVETTLGDLVIDVFVKERPKSSLNFIKLCKMKYYNLCEFHTIQQNYIAQTGDPTGSGRGGESVFVNSFGDQGKYFEKEDLPKLKHKRVGLVAFVNNGEDQLGSQFYITLGDDLDYLDNQHTIFGQVTEGLDTLEKLNEILTDDGHKPFRDIRIAHTIVLEDPFEDPPRMQVPSRSPSPTYDRLVQPSKIALDDNIDDFEGMTPEEIAEEVKRKEMAEQAQILEMVGDLHHADEAPPDNVLFVCKLNPVTTDEDLEIIFGRFGKIIKCEIIRDRRTKASLQYAFVEFDDPKSCEQAFFKMDNVLIDDRRIHVDFSQSVAKNYQWDHMKKKEPQQPHPRKIKREERSPPRRVKREQRSPSPVRHRDRGGSDRDRHNRDRHHEQRVKREVESPPRKYARSSPPRRRRDSPTGSSSRRRHDSPPRRRRSRTPDNKKKGERHEKKRERSRERKYSQSPPRRSRH